MTLVKKRLIKTTIAIIKELKVLCRRHIVASKLKSNLLLEIDLNQSNAI